MSMLDEGAVGTSCSVDPGLRTASAAPNTTDTTSGGHTDERTLGLCEAKEQERRPESSKKLSPNKLALRAHLRMDGKQTAALHACRRA